MIDEEQGHPFHGNQYVQGASGPGKPSVEKVAAAASNLRQQLAQSEERGGFEFVSPSVASHMDFDEALKAIDSPQQRTLRAASATINRDLGITANTHDVVGAWADGAENSVMDRVQNADWDKMKLAAAMKGWLADQKQVLTFQEDSNGHAAMAHFEAKGDLADIHQNLLKDGVAFHTLSPHDGGATVYVADLDGSAIPAIKQAAARYDSEVGIKFGRAEFLGTEKQDGSDREQRDDARKIYEGIIHQSPVEGHDQIWQRVHSSWNQEAKSVGDSFHRKAAGILFFTPQSEVLLMKRRDGAWGLPAGGIEDDETPEHAASREAAEETGHPGDHSLEPFDHRIVTGVSFYTFLQHTEKFDPILNDEHSEYRWCELDDLPKPVHEGLADILKMLISKKK